MQSMCFYVDLVYVASDQQESSELLGKHSHSSQLEETQNKKLKKEDMRLDSFFIQISVRR